METEQVLDALGNEIEIGKYYGYSKMENGGITVVFGKAKKTTNNRVTLSDIIEQYGVYGNINGVREYDRARSVYSKTVFPINYNDYKHIILKYY